MRVLITGGGGFLAGHLAAYLQTIAGLEVYSLRHAGCDLSANNDKERLRGLLRSFRPERIFHLAGRISGQESELDRDNRLATTNLLEAVRQEAPAARIVLGSTTAVYREGGSATAPLAEDSATLLRGAYATSKHAAEQEARRHAEAGGWIATARMSNPVGSNMSTGLLCGTIAKQIVEIERGKEPTLTLRDLKPKRDFIAVRDCVRALWQIADRGERGAIYNVACGESTSIAKVVEVYLSLARVQPIEVRTAAADGERSSVEEQWVSNAKLRMLDWTPQETLHDAVREQLDAERTRA
jgi:nucleoside-diphosphate-sugar epimerase